MLVFITSTIFMNTEHLCIELIEEIVWIKVSFIVLYFL